MSPPGPRSTPWYDSPHHAQSRSLPQLPPNHLQRHRPEPEPAAAPARARPVARALLAQSAAPRRVRRLAYGLWYLFRPPWDTGIPAPELVRTIAGRAPGRALDLGCGTGTNVRYLADHGWQAAGIDYAPGAIRKAWRKCAGLNHITLLVADVTRLAALDLPGPFDLALDMGCFPSLTDDGRQAYAAGLA